MKDGLRFVDCDMHIMEPPDLFERYLDPKFKDRVNVPVGALPALMNAVNDALAPFGVRHLDMPVTPERVWRALRESTAPRPGKTLHT